MYFRDSSEKDQKLGLELKNTSQESHLVGDKSAPITSIPDELLVSIFIVGIPATSSDDPRWEVLLSHVNRHWRYVALDTPALWIKISRAVHQQNFDWQSAYLLRSGLLPFHLKINIWVDAYEEDGEEDGEEQSGMFQRDYIRPFLRFIAPHLHRCQSLYIKSKGESYRGYFSEGVRAVRFLSSVYVPMLKALRVSIADSESEPIQILQGGAGSLTHLDLKNARFFVINPPTENITTLRLGIKDWPYDQSGFQRLRDVLQAMPCLRHLEVHPDRQGPWPSHLPMKLPKLRGLVCRYYHTFFLSAVEAPLLEDLTLHVSGHMFVIFINNTTNPAWAMYCQSNLASVRKLHLIFNNTIVAASVICSFAQAFPFLTQLSCRLLGQLLALDNNLKNVYETLQEVDSLHGQLWPHVTTLDLCELPYSTDFPTNALRTLLIRRAGVGYPIQTITLPKNQLDEGLAMARVTEPRVQVLENAYVAPRYSPQW
ncbi:hypothetical protein FIBSPDRAFT_1042427 [Athelia psychrophila]|uniref:Uncharacterized protein n=1 Tax=Athelia psychrophila TaxID=1759441 RepID=A0A166MNA7_9AGAM|nr:hypothetical protein FIBSPDRAFT_1042427 [Fibularhizoctonia sp. CBS 109695]